MGIACWEGEGLAGEQAAELDLGGKSEETRKEQVLRVLGRLWMV